MQAVALYCTSIGKKALMVLTGLIWIGYVVMHMYGNTKAFLGSEHFNEYAESLRYLGVPVFGHLHLLTIARAVLLASIAVHIWAAWSLYVMAREALSSSYASRRVVQANYAGSTMRYGAVVIVLFIIFHLAYLTWGISPVHPDYIRGDAYHNLVVGFRSLPVVILYLIVLAALGLHLYHGTWSMFQTLGLNDSNWDGGLSCVGMVFGDCCAAWICCGASRSPVWYHRIAWRLDYMATTVTPAVKTVPTFREVILYLRLPDPPNCLVEKAKFDFKLINPANRRRFNIIVVGSGLAGAAAAATLGEMGYNVSCFCYQDSPRPCG